MGYYDFPHTRNYDTDLGYLIDWFKTNKNKIEENTAITIEKALTATEEAVKAYNSATSASNSAAIALELKNQTEALKNLMQDKINQIDTNTNRIDNLATIDQGSITTTADAELVDIRVGTNGITYPSAGDSVRGQVGKLNSDVAAIAKNNLYSIIHFLENKYLDKDNIEKSSNGFRVSDYIEVPYGSDKVSILNYLTTGGKQYPFITPPPIAMFDADKNLISFLEYQSPMGIQTFELGNNVKYIRINSHINDKDNAIISFSSKPSDKEIAKDFYINDIDVLDLKSVVKNKYINNSGIEVQDDNLSHTEYIDVSTLKKINVYNYISGYAYDCKGAFYTEDKTFLSAIKSGIIGHIDVSIPANAKYCIINIPNNVSSEENILIYKKYPKWIDSEFVSKWKGKKAVFLGDSITEGLCISGVTRPYPTVLAEKLEFSSFVNYGVGGSQMTGNSDDSFINRYQTMDNDADLVVVMGGTNDALFGGGAAWLGTINDVGQGNISFYGGVDYLIKGLRAKYPSATIVFMTPMHYYDKNGNPTSGEKQTDKQFDLWANAIEEVCKRDGIPCIDFRNVCGLNPNFESQRNMYFQDKWVHYNQNGIEFAVERIYKQFELY